MKGKLNTCSSYLYDRKRVLEDTIKRDEKHLLEILEMYGKDDIAFMNVAEIITRERKELFTVKGCIEELEKIYG